MPPLRNLKRERFACLLFEHVGDPEWPAYKCYQEAYGCSARAAMSNANKLLKITEIGERIAELEEEAATTKIMTVREIEERLSEIGRARMTDFVEAGADGSYISVGPESCHSAAIQEITSRTEYDDDGANAAVITKLKLHDPMKAMDMLLKRKGAYPAIGRGDGDGALPPAPQVFVIVASDAGRQLTDMIVTGIRTEPLKITEKPGGNGHKGD